MDELLRMEHVSKRFGDFYANRDINLSVRKGEVHTLLGENGAGKSTLMNVLIGLYQPTEGKIFLNGKEVRIDSPAQAVKLGIGMVHQHFMLVEAMTVFENIILGDRNTKGIFIDKEARKNAQIVSNTAEAFPTAKETKASVIPTLVCGAISAVIGAVPGTGGDIAAIICWQQTKNFSKHPEEFGKGAVNGLAVTSCANNAVIGGAMTTMMTLGIPGDGVTAVLIGSLMMYGMQPGPMMFVEKPEFVYNVMGLMVVGYIMILILGLLSTKFASLILKVPQEVIWVIVVGFCILGSYAVNNSMFDVYVMFAAGFVGFLCKRCEVPLGPFVLALLLGNLCESNFRRALSMSLGDYSIFLTRPITVVLLILTVLSLVLPAIGQLRKKSKAAK